MGKNLSVYLNDDDVKLFEKSQLTIGQLVSQALKQFNNDSIYKVKVSFMRSEQLLEKLLVSGVISPSKHVDITFEIAAISQEVIDFAKSQEVFYARKYNHVLTEKGFAVWLDCAKITLIEPLNSDITELNFIALAKEALSQHEREIERINLYKANQSAKIEQEEIEAKEREEKREKAQEASREAKQKAIADLVGRLKFSTDDDLQIIAESNYKNEFVKELVSAYLLQSGLNIAHTLFSDHDCAIDGIEEIGVKKAREAILARQKIEGLLSTVELISYEFSSFLMDNGVLGYEYQITLPGFKQFYFIFME